MANHRDMNYDFFWKTCRLLWKHDLKKKMLWSRTLLRFTVIFWSVLINSIPHHYNLKEWITNFVIIFIGEPNSPILWNGCGNTDISNQPIRSMSNKLWIESHLEGSGHSFSFQVRFLASILHRGLLRMTFFFLFSIPICFFQFLLDFYFPFNMDFP